MSQIDQADRLRDQLRLMAHPTDVYVNTMTTMLTRSQLERLRKLEGLYLQMRDEEQEAAALEASVLVRRSAKQLEQGPSMMAMATVSNAAVGWEVGSDIDAFSDTSMEVGDSADETNAFEDFLETGSQGNSSFQSNSTTQDETGLQNISFTNPHPDSPPEQDIEVSIWMPEKFVLDYVNDGDPTDTMMGRFDPGLVLRTVMMKADGYDDKAEALKMQGSVCGNDQCGAELTPSFSPFRMGFSLDHARFCYYTGYYFCEECHPRTRVEYIPSRVLNNWDFVKLSVCDASGDFLDLHFDDPILHVSSINPGLYDRVPLLRAAMKIRVQLNILHEIGMQCPKFKEIFYGRDSTARQSSSLIIDSTTNRNRDRQKGRDDRRRAAYGTDETTIPNCKRYLVENHEFWSMADLVSIHEGSGHQNTAASLEVPLLKYLKEVRTQMVKHVVQNCRESCFSRGVKKCPLCEDSENLVFTFDTNNVWACPRCHSAYHKRCVKKNSHRMPAGTCIVCDRKQRQVGSPKSMSPR